MSSRRLVDTNLIVRFLVQDHEKHAKSAAKLFASCDDGELRLVVLPAVLAECVFVLESFYKHPRADIARVLSKLVDSPGIELAGLASHIDALERYSRSRAHFVDCVLAATAAAEGVAIASSDGDFQKFADVEIRVD